jgi:hypothetical protein
MSSSSDDDNDDLDTAVSEVLSSAYKIVTPGESIGPQEGYLRGHGAQLPTDPHPRSRQPILTCASSPPPILCLTSDDPQTAARNDTRYLPQRHKRQAPTPKITGRSSRPCVASWSA